MQRGKNSSTPSSTRTASQVKMTACQILRAAQQLNYVYEMRPPQIKEYCLRFPRPWWISSRRSSPLADPSRRTQASPSASRLSSKKSASASLPSWSKTDTLFLELDDVEAENQPGVAWAVYVGLPRGSNPTAKARTTPDRCPFRSGHP